MSCKNIRKTEVNEEFNFFMSVMLMVTSRLCLIEPDGMEDFMCQEIENF